MLKLSNLVEACRSVAHFCSEQVSVFRQSFNRVVDNALDTTMQVAQSIVQAPELNFRP